VEAVRAAGGELEYAEVNAICDFAHGTKLTACPVCGSEAIGRLLVAEDFHYGIAGSYAADKCRDCDLVFLNPMPTTADLAALYPTDYYSYQTPTLPAGPKVVLRRVLGMERNTLVPEFARPGVMLDLGCGAGHYLLKMRAAGWTVFGSELSQAAADAGRSAGLDIRGGELMDAGFEDEKFDFVRLNHSFEHMYNPFEVLAEIRRILKPEGKLFIGVPNVSGFWARLFGKYWWNFGAPVHTFNYSPKNLKILLEKAGFGVERVRYYSDYSGLLGSAQIYFTRNKAPRSSEGFFTRSWLLRPFGQAASRLTDVLGQGDCIEVISSKRTAA
jgi:SAM-dependent methyltransferase